MKGNLLEAMLRLDQMGERLEKIENLPSVRDKVIVRDKMRELRREAWEVKAEIFRALVETPK